MLLSIIAIRSVSLHLSASYRINLISERGKQDEMNKPRNRVGTDINIDENDRAIVHFRDVHAMIITAG